MLTISPLQRNMPIAGDLPASPEYHIWWQNVITSLISTINEQQEQILQIQQALDLAEEAKESAARTASYTVPTNVLTSADTGSSTAKIVVAAHTRIYPSNSGLPDVSILGAEITGLLNATTYYVYYDDPTLADTTPTFMTTTTQAAAQVGAGTSRHFVGAITTAASGGGSTGGTGGSPPGGGGGTAIP